ncbi:hypothetical protein DZ956_022420 [Pseudomonas aeruginosa]|uniref:hypothetical protein n=1 Tax=Pseudomonas aeruginosa TaxID=287 RepID=UPI0015C54AC2|nr:hypothetical protein [Pseudomonas aeruginosa]NPZ19533.1 hypothetical protein [Pseudomonas aeruginosa]
MTTRLQCKLFSSAPAVKFRVVNESASGVNRVRIEGEVFGAKGSTVKHFASAEAAEAFYAALTERDAERWWQGVYARVQEQIFGLAEQELLYGSGQVLQARGLLHA